MKIEQFNNFDSESLIFYKEISGKIKNTKFSQTPSNCFKKKLRFDQLAQWVG